MQSYCSDVTRYLLAASEGASIITGKMVKVDIMDFAKQIDGEGMVRYRWGDPGSSWAGNIEHHFGADHDTSARIVIAARTLDINVLERAFKYDIVNVGAQIAKVTRRSQSEAEAYFMCGIQGDGAHGEVDTVTVLLGSTKLGDDVLRHRKLIAKTIALFRVLRSMTRWVGKEDLVVKERETIRDTVDRLWPIVDDPERFAEVMSTASKTEQMIMYDMRCAPEDAEKADYVVAAARNRSITHLRGAGGFIINCFGRKFEISSRGDGSSGMFYREYVLGETTEKSGDTTYGGSVSVSAGFSVVGFIPSVEASVTVEANFSKSMGWSITTEENPTEWKMVHEKTFLDGLGKGPTSLGKLLLMMNWHVGGLDDWHVSPTCSKWRHGCVMKEEPLSLEVAYRASSVKIDSYFRMGDVLAASGIDDCNWNAFLEYDGKERKVLDFSKRGKKYVSLMKLFPVEAGKNVAGMNQSFMDELVGKQKILGSIPTF